MAGHHFNKMKLAGPHVQHKFPKKQMDLQLPRRRPPAATRLRATGRGRGSGHPSSAPYPGLISRRGLTISEAGWVTCYFGDRNILILADNYLWHNNPGWLDAGSGTVSAAARFT